MIGGSVLKRLHYLCGRGFASIQLSRATISRRRSISDRSRARSRGRRQPADERSREVINAFAARDLVRSRRSRVSVLTLPSDDLPGVQSGLALFVVKINGIAVAFARIAFVES
jgi:hypothetical protein